MIPHCEQPGPEKFLPTDTLKKGTKRKQASAAVLCCSVAVASNIRSFAKKKKRRPLQSPLTHQGPAGPFFAFLSPPLLSFLHLISLNEKWAPVVQQRAVSSSSSPFPLSLSSHSEANISRPTMTLLLHIVQCSIFCKGGPFWNCVCACVGLPVILEAICMPRRASSIAHSLPRLSLAMLLPKTRTDERTDAKAVSGTNCLVLALSLSVLCRSESSRSLGSRSLRRVGGEVFPLKKAAGVHAYKPLREFPQGKEWHARRREHMPERERGEMPEGEF